MNSILVLCGKSASGKDTLQKELINMGMKAVVSYTTRPPRIGEMDGITYHFISEEEFLDKEKNNFFAESTSYDTVHGKWYYGSAAKDLTDEKVVILNPEGLKSLKNIENIDPISFYIIADDETIWNRLRKRGDDSAEARRRLNADDEDFTGIDKYVDFAIRNDGSVSTKEIAEMIMYLYKKVGEKNGK